MLSSAATYAPKNIRVNAVAPGLTRTPLADRITSNAAALKVRPYTCTRGRPGGGGGGGVREGASPPPPLLSCVQ